MSEQKLYCPHCSGELRAFEMPLEAAYDDIRQYACFNDTCPYFVKGWDWMWEKYRAKTSYRYRITNKETGAESPLPVWSNDAIKDHIIDEDK